MVTENNKNESWYDEHCSNYPDETDPDSIRFAYYGRELKLCREAEKRWEEAFGTDDRVP